MVHLDFDATLTGLLLENWRMNLIQLHLGGLVDLPHSPHSDVRHTAVDIWGYV